MDAEAIVELGSLLYGVSGNKHKVLQKNVLLRCPFAPYKNEHAHDVDVHPGFSVAIAPDGTSVCHCFTCKEGGSLLFTMTRLQEISGNAFSAALSWTQEHESPEPLVKLHRTHLENEADSLESQSTHKLASKSLPALVVKWQKLIPKYLLKRGLTRKEIKAWELGYDPDKKRATFPIRNINGQLVAVYGRALLANQTPKYWLYTHLSAEITNYFYGEHLLDLTRSLSTGIILTEGPMDCIKMNRVAQNVLALCGTNVTPERRQRLKEWGEPVTLCLDNDPAGISAMQKIAKAINKVVPNVYRIILPQGKDPWDCTEDELKAALKTKSLFLS